MRGVASRSNPKRIVSFTTAAAHGGTFTQADNTEQANPSKVGCAEKSAFTGQQGVPPTELQEILWKQFFADAGQWLDNRRSKPTPRHPDFRHKESKVPLWLNNRHKPVWVDRQLAAMDADLRMSVEIESTSAPTPRVFEAAEGHVKAKLCRQLCEDGSAPDAVDALNILVQQGFPVPSSLFSRVLKRCMQNKDLALGTRVHALSVQSGYEGDALLATHFIGHYASHRRLKEATEVFSKVPTPDAYNWATLIFAYARHRGAAEAAEAVRLYRQMCKMGTIKPDDCLYSAVLKACAASKDLATGKEIHSRILEDQGRLDEIIGGRLVNMYAKCGSIEEAQEVFDNLPDKNVVTWTAMIAGYAQQGMGQEALTLYNNMQQEGLMPNSVTFLCVLQACASGGVSFLQKGKRLHVQIADRGLEEDAVLGGGLVNMYAKCGSMEDARRIFDKLPDKNVRAWTAMIGAYSQRGMGQEALRLLGGMKKEGRTPNAVTYVCLLQACASIGVGALREGQQLHREIEERGLEEGVVLGGSLVNMYAKCGGLEYARVLFDRLPKRSVVAWTAMIAGYAQQEMGQEALNLYSSMQQEGLAPNSVTYICLLQACASVGVGALHEGKDLHAQIEEQGVQIDAVLGGSLVNMYAKCGCLKGARSLFEKLPGKSIVAWTAMIAGYAQHGMGQEALHVYHNMQQEGLTPDSVTYLCLLQACAIVGVSALHKGKQLHAQLKERGLENDVVLGGSLVDMYARCGSLEDARSLFNNLSDRNIVAWTAMIAGYAQQGMGEEALSLYRRMQEQGVTPNVVTYISLLQACASVGVSALAEGKQLHAQIEKECLLGDVVLGSSLLNMYMKCGNLEEAHMLLNNLPERSVEAWTTMIAGYAQQGMGHEALGLYSSMRQEGVTPDSVNYVCMLQACAAVAALPLGLQLHAEIEERGMQGDVNVGTALVNMYAKCGCISDSRRVFDSLSERSIEAWNALLGGYSRQGDSRAVFNMIDKMTLEGIEPNDITFLGVLTVCSHVGLVDKGREYFEAMRTIYGITATMEHYLCMVDLLGRAGHLHEAVQMAKSMPFPPNDVMWHTLLGACQKWKNVELGQQVFKGAVSMDEKDAAAYSLMSNIYASTRMGEGVEELQARRTKLGAGKRRGQSWWTDSGGVLHTFSVGDKKASRE